MNPLSLCWYLLSIVGNLPEELIIKILYNYGGLRHPNVSILLKSTENEAYEALQNLPISNSIYKFYLNKDKYSALFDIDIISYLNNKQTSYFRELELEYTHHNDPGYFFPRQFGRLYYEVVNDELGVNTSTQIDWSRKNLVRSKKMLESKKESYKQQEKRINRGVRRVYLPDFDYNNVDKNIESFTHKLMYIEKDEKIMYERNSKLILKKSDYWYWYRLFKSDRKRGTNSCLCGGK